MGKNKTIQLELSVQEVNTILDGLAELPFKDVYKLIESIHQQAGKNEEPIA